MNSELLKITRAALEDSGSFIPVMAVLTAGLDLLEEVLAFDSDVEPHEYEPDKSRHYRWCRICNKRKSHLFHSDAVRAFIKVLEEVKL